MWDFDHGTDATRSVFWEVHLGCIRGGLIGVGRAAREPM